MFSTCNGIFVLAKARARNPPNRTHSSAAACGGFYSVIHTIRSIRSKNSLTAICSDNPLTAVVLVQSQATCLGFASVCQAS